MNTRDQFGNYLLLKKLSEDPLGEIFRAGRMGKQALERIVLLRVYNGQGIDTDRLGQKLQSRAAVQQALKSPNIGQGVDLGLVRGVPFVAYEYVSGRTLAQLAEQASKRRIPIPLDHAMLMAERVALGLAVAYETRLGDDRIVHGFLTPHHILVSNEGEIRLLGFESSTGLRDSAGHPLLKDAVGRFLPPEALAGQAPAKTDDVYSLGAILFELLTAQKVPMAGSTIGAAIDQATVAADGGQLHPDLAALLKRSLGPREGRPGDVVAWHKTLSKLMFDGQYNPTTFNLAFFMHNLFRDEIERESQELELEKTTAIPTAKVAAAAAAATMASPPTPLAPMPPMGGAGAPVPMSMSAQAASEPVRDSGPVRESTAVIRDRYGIGGEKKSKMPIILAASIGGLAVLGIVAWLVMGSGGSTPPPPAAAPAAGATAPVPTPGERQAKLQAEIDKLIDEKTKSFSSQYEQRIKDLQKQLEDAKRPPSSAASNSAGSSAASHPASPAPAPAPTTTAPSTRPSRTDTSSAATPSTEPAPSAADTKAAAPAAEPPAPIPAPPTPAAEAPVKPGDLVAIGAVGVTPPRILRKTEPEYPPVARRLRREGSVTIRVLVDENGKVVEAEATGTKSGYGFEESALLAARRSTFSPATKGGVPVKVWYEMKFTFALKNG